jgi:hypothetical protein
MSARRTWITLAIVAGLFIAAWKVAGPVQPPPGVTLSDLKDVDQLSALFNEARGTPRMILVLSPT